MATVEGEQVNVSRGHLADTVPTLSSVPPRMLQNSSSYSTPVPCVSRNVTARGRNDAPCGSHRRIEAHDRWGPRWGCAYRLCVCMMLSLWCRATRVQLSTAHSVDALRASAALGFDLLALRSGLHLLESAVADALRDQLHTNSTNATVRQNTATLRFWATLVL